MKCTDAHKLLILAGVVAWVISPVVALAQESSWSVDVDFAQALKQMDPAYASASVNNPAAMLQDEAFDQAVKSLGFRMMRFQGPIYHDYKTPFAEEEFQELDAAVAKAHDVWGVQDLMFGIHRISLPMDGDGKLIREDFSLYAARCAELVQRYASPGNVQVRYWEPFNELDNKLDQYDDAVDLYIQCAQAMKAVNPDIKVGGPSLCSAGKTNELEKLIEGTPHILPDFVSWHDYATGNAGASDASVLRTLDNSVHFAGGANRVQDVLNSYWWWPLIGRPDPGDIPQFMDEYHVNWAAGSPPDERVATEFGAVFAASVLARMSESPVERTFIHDVNIKHYGLVGQASEDRFGPGESDPDGIRVRPIGWVYRWFNQYVGGEWVSCDALLPEADLTSDRGPLLESCAWINDEHGVVMLVNKDINPHDVEISLGNVLEEFASFPWRVMTIAGDQPEDTQFVYTQDGQLALLLPEMSVTFLVVPEPTSLVLLGIGGALGVFGRRRK